MKKTQYIKLEEMKTELYKICDDIDSENALYLKYAIREIGEVLFAYKLKKLDED